jgi:hypothetical protein
VKILFYTDAHFRETSSYPPFNRVQVNGLTGELNNTILGFTFLLGEIERHEPNLVINIGDSFHKDNAITVRTLHAVKLGFTPIELVCKRMEIDHLIMMGNHDIYAIMEDGTRITSICALEKYGTIVTDNMTYDLNKDFRLYLMPYTDDMDEGYQGILEGSSGSNLIVAHMDFIGAVHDNNHPVETGLDPNVAVPVVCGHIHLPQEVGNVTFIGSLLMNRFTRESLSDIGGVLVYDVDTGEKQLIKNNQSKHFIKVRDLNKLKYLDPDRCILKIYSETPEEELKDLLEGFQYMFINLKDKDDATKEAYLSQEIVSPEVLLRSFISEEKPEFVELYDEVIK